MRKDHRRIEQLLLLAGEVPIDDAELRRVLDTVDAHLDAEVSVLYPLVERWLPDRIGAVRELRARLKDSLARVWALKGRARQSEVAALRAEFRDHARLEERVVLPALEGLLTASALGDLGAHFGRARITRT